MLSKVSLLTVGIISVVQTNGEHLRTNTGTHACACPGTCDAVTGDWRAGKSTCSMIGPNGAKHCDTTGTTGRCCVGAGHTIPEGCSGYVMAGTTTGTTYHYFFPQGSGHGPPMTAYNDDKRAGCRCTNHVKVASVCNSGCGVDDSTPQCKGAAANPDFGPPTGAQNRGHCAGACLPNQELMESQEQKVGFTFDECEEQCDEMGNDWSMIDGSSREMATGSGCGFDGMNVWKADPCHDSPSDWKSSTSNTCSDYSEFQWCTPDGGYGTGWKDGLEGRLEGEYGTFAKWAVNGVDASQACCACGGGD